MGCRPLLAAGAARIAAPLLPPRITQPAAHILLPTHHDMLGGRGGRRRHLLQVERFVLAIAAAASLAIAAAAPSAAAAAATAGRAVHQPKCC